jgi:hypothetical protein
MKFPTLTLALSSVTLLCLLARSPEILFERKTLDLGTAETCTVADFNKDGKPDIFSGESWYENPTWKKHQVRQLKEYGTYLGSLTDIALDVDGDGFPDIVSSGWHTNRIWWSRNPGKNAAMWQDTTIDEGFPVEFAFLVDLNNDGKAQEILPQWGNNAAALTWYELANGKFQKHVVNSRSYGHGIGAGDVNGDGKNDIITPQGWFEAPPGGTGEWKLHPEFNLGSTSFIYAIDLNEDGLPDLLTAMAHDYGIFWMEQRPDHTWTKHVIDQSWSQAHALTLVDLNGDGRKDLLTGKRYMAHDGNDPGEREPLGIYWYEYRPAADHKTVEWSRHLIDYGSRAGGGMQIPVVDLDSDGDLDFAVAGKSGLFLFENMTKAALRESQRTR